MSVVIGESTFPPLMASTNPTLDYIFRFSLGSYKYVGFTIFTLRRDTLIEFKLKSVATISLAVYYIVCSFAMISFRTLHEYTTPYFQYDVVTATEKFCARVQATNYYCSDFIAILFTFWRRRNIIQHHKLLIQFFEFHGSSSSLEYSECARSGIKFLQTLRSLIILTFASQLVLSNVMNILLLSQPPWNEMLWTWFAMPMFSIFWASLGTLRFHSRLWIVAYFIAYELASTLIKIKIQECLNLRRCRKSAESVKSVTTMFKNLELCVSSFNKSFTYVFLLEFLSMISLEILHIFEIVYDLKRASFKKLFQIGDNLILISVLLVAFCNSAHKFERQMSKCVALLRNVPTDGLPGDLLAESEMLFIKYATHSIRITAGSFFSLNRRLLSAVRVTLTSFPLIILVF